MFKGLPGSFIANQKSKDDFFRGPFNVNSCLKFSGYFSTGNILFQTISTPLTWFKSPLPSHSITLDSAFIILGFLDLLSLGICNIPPWDRYGYLMKPCNRASILLACSQLSRVLYFCHSRKNLHC